MLLGQPLFPGESGVAQLVEIIKVLGTPSREEINAMNPNYTEFRFPQIKAHPWSKVFHKRMPADAVDLVSKLLQYSPNLRYDALQVLTQHVPVSGLGHLRACCCLLWPSFGGCGQVARSLASRESNRMLGGAETGEACLTARLFPLCSTGVRASVFRRAA